VENIRHNFMQAKDKKTNATVYEDAVASGLDISEIAHKTKLPMTSEGPRKLNSLNRVTIPSTAIPAPPKSMVTQMTPRTPVIPKDTTEGGVTILAEIPAQTRNTLPTILLQNAGLE